MKHTIPLLKFPNGRNSELHPRGPYLFEFSVEAKQEPSLAALVNGDAQDIKEDSKSNKQLTNQETPFKKDEIEEHYLELEPPHADEESEEQILIQIEKKNARCDRL